MRNKMKKVMRYALLLTAFVYSVAAFASQGSDTKSDTFSYTFTNNNKTISCDWRHTVSFSYSVNSLSCTSASLIIDSLSECLAYVTNGTVSYQSSMKFTKPDFATMKTYDDKQWAVGTARTIVQNSAGTITISYSKSVQQVKNEY